MVKENKMRQTEIGLLPDDWEVRELSEIGTFKNGINKGAEDFGFGSPFVNLMDVFGKNVISSNISFGLVNSNNTEKEIYNVRSGDVIFIRSSVKPSGVGKTVLIQSDLKDTVYSGFLIRYRNNTLSSKFKRYCFDAEYFRNNVIAGSTVSANTNINQDTLKSLKLAFPKSLPEQEAIAEALNDADAWIECLEQLISKKRLIKQGAMQELLTPKEDWEVKKLGEMGNIVIGLTYSPNDVRDFGTLVLRSSNVQKNKLAFENNVYVDMDLPERVIVKENDLLVCVRNGSKNLIGKCALIDKKTEGQAFGAFMSVVRSDFGKYLFHYFQTYYIQTQIDENLGATINQLTNATLKSFDINIPKSLTEQTRIATILSDMDAELEALEVQLGKARTVKQGMMQELLTGRVRLM